MFQVIALALRYVRVDLCRCLQPLDRGSFSWIYDKHNKPLWICQGPVRPRSCRIFSTQNPSRSWLPIGFRKENPYNFGGNNFPLPFYSIVLGKFCYILWDMFRSSSDALELVRFASEKGSLKNELRQIKEWAFQCLFLDDTMSTRLGHKLHGRQNKEDGFHQSWCFFSIPHEMLCMTIYIYTVRFLMQCHGTDCPAVSRENPANQFRYTSLA